MKDISCIQRFTPAMPDVVFGVVLATVLIGGRTGLLNDPGTFWHLRLGREIVGTGHVPRVDTLTYTRQSSPWVDQSWAFDALLAIVVDRAGWPAAIVATALGLAALYAAMARSLIRDGSSPAVAAIVALLAVGISANHFLIRPHLFTLGAVFWTLRACRLQHDRGGWAIGCVPLVVMVWANVHGGFLAGPLIVLCALAGEAVSGPWDDSRKRNLTRFGLAFGLSLFTPLLNPYGIGLYRHVFHLLGTSGVTKLIEEYQPIPFGSSEFVVFEVVLLGLVALPSLARGSAERFDLVAMLVWLHLALASLRHAPLFAMAAAPVLARLIDGLPHDCRDLGRGWPARTCWPPLIAIGMTIALWCGVPFAGFDSRTWPIEALSTLNRQPAGARLFHEQDWGGLIEAECNPPRRAFVDDRFELFGKDAIVEYADALQGGPAWDQLLDRERIELVWIRPDRPLAERLAGDAQWELLHRDAVSAFYRRRADRPLQMHKSTSALSAHSG